ncbi:MAG: ribosome small subunit-dependent GTPase A [Cytophagia bacterium]|nr:ribosome small subunit-dependent GTPase A [Cytophagia bacterium]
MKGLVLKSTGSWYLLLGEDNRRYQARVRGKLRLEGIKETNPVAVGDYVKFEIEGEEGIISGIEDRENYIARQSVKKTGHTHILAANVDQALLVVTLAFPRTSLGFIDRFIVAAESFRIPQIIVFNKSDILTEEQQTEVEALMQLYQRLDIRCIQTSATQTDQHEVEALLQNKKTLISGHSGVGKSTLINQLSKNIQQKTSEISDFSAKGTHTTTFAEMFQLNEHTFIIDTPGIKELGLVNMEPEELSDYFTEMRALRSSCKFGGRCLHINEPKCAVIEAVNNGTITTSRYESYVSMVKGEDNRK